MRKKISPEQRAKLFIWSDRHCCFCDKKCTTNIVIHHIDNNNENYIEDNLIPICFDCHSSIESYNPKHPTGAKYKEEEIKSRRYQIYEKYTLKYSRPVKIDINQYINTITGLKKRNFGDISFNVISLSNDLPIQVKVKCIVYSNEKMMINQPKGIYAGENLINLNPNGVLLGHFDLHMSNDPSIFPIRFEVYWSIIDIVGREHIMLPFSYVWSKVDRDDFYYDPRVIFDPYGKNITKKSPYSQINRLLREPFL